MRLSCLPFLATLLIPAIACADDSFVFSRKYVQPEAAQQQEQQQEPEQQVPPQSTPYAAQPTAAIVPSAADYSGQQGIYGNANEQRAVINTGGNIHEIPATPPGWDSLTTGTSNGGGVLGRNNGMNSGYDNNGNLQSTLNGNPLTNGSAAQGLLGGMANGEQRVGYGDVSVSSEGEMSAKERAMYASFLSSLLQYVKSQPDTAVANPGYNGGGFQPVNPAYNTAVPIQGSQPARFGGTMGVSAPAVPCPRGVGHVAGTGC